LQLYIKTNTIKLIGFTSRRGLSFVAITYICFGDYPILYDHVVTFLFSFN